MGKYGKKKRWERYWRERGELQKIKRKGKEEMGIIIALISGALMSVQGVFNTELTKSSSTWVANVWVQFTALLVCLAAWVVTGRQEFGGLLRTDSKIYLTGGIIGAFITWTVIQSMGALGPARAVMLIVVSQILVAYVIEFMGWFGVEKRGFDLTKLVGMALAIAGIVVFKWKD